MYRLMQLLNEVLTDDNTGIAYLDKFKPISKISDLDPLDNTPGFNGYAICGEFISGTNKYKNRKGKFDTAILLNTYSNVKNGDMAVLNLNSDVIDLLDEADLSAQATPLGLKIYNITYDSSSPQPQYNSRLQCWQSVVKVNIRWEEV